MAGYNILIVDDQREVSRILRSGLESLDEDLVISDVLSGEEAMLELTRDPINLLISDIRLPGISGFQVMERFKAHNENTKVILISGVQEPKLRQQVAQAGADAFFFKPIEISDFLDGVERALGLVDTILPNEMSLEREEIAEEEEKQATGMGERITRLRDDIGASTVLLVSDRGQILVRTGELPDKKIESVILPQITSYMGFGTQISRDAGSPTPRTYMTARGADYDLHIVHVGAAYALCILTAVLKASEVAKVAAFSQVAASDILINLAKLGVAPDQPVPLPAEQPAAAKVDGKSAEPVVEKPAPPEEPEEDLSDPEMEALFSNGEVAVDNADDFWEQGAQKISTPSLTSGDSLTYEQALQLGLAPPLDGDK